MESNSQILIYQTEDGRTKIQTLLENETVWLSQAQIALLFDKGRSTITEHISNILKKVNFKKVLCVGISDIPLNTVLLKVKRRKRMSKITIWMSLFQLGIV